jgi:hypothetical protein
VRINPAPIPLMAERERAGFFRLPEPSRVSTCHSFFGHAAVQRARHGRGRYMYFVIFNWQFKDL